MVWSGFFTCNAQGYRQINVLVFPGSLQLRLGDKSALYFTWQASIYVKYRGKQPKNKHNYSLPGKAVCMLNVEENTQQISNMITYIFMYIFMFVLQIPQLEFQWP